MNSYEFLASQVKSPQWGGPAGFETTMGGPKESHTSPRGPSALGGDNGGARQNPVGPPHCGPTWLVKNSYEFIRNHYGINTNSNEFI